MGVLTSEVGYTPAMPRTEDHEVHKGHVVALGRKSNFAQFLKHHATACQYFWYLQYLTVYSLTSLLYYLLKLTSIFYEVGRVLVCYLLRLLWRQRQQISAKHLYLFFKLFGVTTRKTVALTSQGPRFKWPQHPSDTGLNVRRRGHNAWYWHVDVGPLINHYTQLQSKSPVGLKVS